MRHVPVAVLGRLFGGGAPGAVSLERAAEEMEGSIRVSATFDVEGVEALVRALAREYVKKGAVPPDYPADSLHVALATVNGIDYLLSWNFQHLVRVRTRKIVDMVNVSLGYPELGILTPAELI